MSAASLRADPFRLLGDPVRLRLLRLLARERLNVSELTRVLGIAQSGVSRHVRLLRDAGFVTEERDGGWTWLALARTDPPGLGAAWAEIRSGLARGLEGDDGGDDARLAEIRRERHERRVGWGEGATGRRLAEPGRSWAAWARALGHLLPPREVADLGCGDGALTLEIARWATRVVGVESAGLGLERAREASLRAGVSNVTWQEGDLGELPLPDGTFDLALLSQVLHRLDEPLRAIEEAARVTRAGGRVLVMDLLPHGESWVRGKLGHRRLGFEGEDMREMLVRAGLDRVRCEEAARRRGNPFTVLLASGRRPDAEEKR